MDRACNLHGKEEEYMQGVDRKSRRKESARKT
jgi:hypothetical protein